MSLSTTGYGDITPVAQSARLVNILFITPARVLFLIILVGTTLEVLTEQYRTSLGWAGGGERVKDHVIVCGYGTKGRAAVSALLENGLDKSRIVVVESSAAALRQATADGLVADRGLRDPFVGAEGGARQERQGGHHRHRQRRRVGAGHADRAAADRRPGPHHRGGPGGRRTPPLLRQSGAHHVIVSSATAGRLLGLSTTAPPLIDVVEDLLTPGQGMALAMRSAERRRGRLAPRASCRRWSSPWSGAARWSPSADRAGATIETGDMLVYVRDDDRPPATPLLTG